MLRQQLANVESAPLLERQDARKEYADDSASHPEVVAQRVWWLLTGCYGYGSYVAALRIADNPRMNRPAALAIMVAALEWFCPAAFARQAFNGLTTEQQATLTKAIRAEIRDYETEKAEQAQEQATA